MIVRELITRLGFDSDQAERAAKRYDQVVGGLRRNLIRLAAVAAGFVSGAVFVRMATDMARTAEKASDLAATVGLTAEEIQGLMFAAQRLGISTQLTESALRAFGRRIGAADQGGGPAINAVKRFKLELRDANGEMRPLIDLFFEVANGIQKLGSEAEQIEIADQFFSETGRPLSLLLREGEEGIRRYMSRQRALGGLISGFNLKIASKFMDNLKDFKVAMDGLRFAIGAELLPPMTKMLQRFLEWFVANKDIIHQNIGDFIRGVAFTLRLFVIMLGQAARAVNEVVQSMGGWEKVLRLLTAALLATGIRSILRFIIKIAPGVVAALTSIRGALRLLRALLLRFPGVLLILAIEDFLAFLQGAPSIIGKVADKIEDWKDAIIGWINDVRKAVKEWWADSAIGRFFSFVAEGVDDVRNFGHRLGLGGGIGQPPRFAGGMPRTFHFDIRENVNVNVPPGTSQEQAQEIERQVRGHVRTELERQVRGALNEEPAH